MQCEINVSGTVSEYLHTHSHVPFSFTLISQMVLDTVYQVKKGLFQSIMKNCMNNPSKVEAALINILC